jgi:hypothetical protein
MVHIARRTLDRDQRDDAAMFSPQWAGISGPKPFHECLGMHLLRFSGHVKGKKAARCRWRALGIAPANAPLSGRLHFEFTARRRRPGTRRYGAHCQRQCGGECGGPSWGIQCTRLLVQVAVAVLDLRHLLAISISTRHDGRERQARLGRSGGRPLAVLRTSAAVTCAQARP